MGRVGDERERGWIESTEEGRMDQLITVSQQGLTFVGNFPDSAINALPFSP